MNRFKTDDSAKFVEFVNEQISALAQSDFIPLGPAYSSMSDDDIQNNLILHRLCSKFEIPDSGNSKIRKDATINAALSYDADGVVEFNPAKMNLDSQVRKSLYETRNQLHTVISSYGFDLGSTEITTGESFWSAGGDTSILAKLRDKEQWCVTPECFSLFAGVAYRVTALKKQVRWHYYNQFKPLYKLFIAKVKFFTDFEDEEHERAVIKKAARYFWKRIHKENLGLVYSEHKDSKSVGFICFKHMLRKIVTFVGGTRFTTVPKNNDTDRVIECEAMCNMVVQRIIANGIRQVIKQHYKIDLDVAQYKHKAIISRWFELIATIDLKNASNSNWMSVVEWLYAKSRLLRHIQFSRCSHVKVGDNWSYLNMVAPMGNGFTFELMTLTLLACCRHFDDTSRVYGDDIIIAKGKAHQLTSLLDVLGYKLNTTKTFFDGNFRESCGGFVSLDRKYLSYEFHYASDLFDAIILVNKLRNVSRVATGDLRYKLAKAYQKIIDRAPLLCLCGYDNDLVPLESAIYLPYKYLKKLHTKDKSWMKLCNQLMHKFDKTIKDYQYKKFLLTPGVRVNKKSICYRNAPLQVSDPHWITYYVHGGRVTKPSLGKEIVTTSVVLYLGYSSNFIS